jgi:hypothetical protein
MPTAVETRNASATYHGVMVVDHPAKWTTSFAIAKPKRMPSNPPSALIVIASIKSCVLVSPRRAPMTLRTPISFVRLSTLASVMFMMPMPPASSEIRVLAGN